MKKKLIALLTALCLLAGMAPLALAEVLDFDIPESGEDLVAEFAGDLTLDELPIAPGDLIPEAPVSVDIELPAESNASSDANAAKVDNPCDVHEYELVDFDHYECKVCSQTKKFTPAKLKIKYIGKRLSKPYDKTSYLGYTKTDPETGEKSTVWLMSEKLTTDMFKIEVITDSVTGKTYDQIKIAGLAWADSDNTGLPGVDAGNYKLRVRPRLEGDDLGYYKLTESSGRYYSPSVVTVPAKITKRTVTVIPMDRTYTTSSGGTVDYAISKTYGETDKFIPFSVDGLLKLTPAETEAGAKLYTGRLSREPGEDAGKYLITMGTLDFGNSNYKVKLKKTYFTIKRKSIKASGVDMLALGDQIYTGKAIKPSVIMRDGMTGLREGVDYTLSYQNNKAVGKATVTITGKGNYKSSRKATFKILPQETALTGLTAGKGQLTVQWNKQSGVTGYQVSYSLKKSFSSASKKTVKGAKKTSVTLKSLTSKKTYYVRIRTYKTVSGKTYYSPWSDAQKLKTK